MINNIWFVHGVGYINAKNKWNTIAVGMVLHEC